VLLATMSKVVEDIAIERSDFYLPSSDEELLRAAKREGYQTLDPRKTELEEINWLKQKKKGVCEGNRVMSPNLGHYKVNRISL